MEISCLTAEEMERLKKFYDIEQPPVPPGNDRQKEV